MGDLEGSTLRRTDRWLVVVVGWSYVFNGYWIWSLGVGGWVWFRAGWGLGGLVVWRLVWRLVRGGCAVLKDEAR